VARIGEAGNVPNPVRATGRVVCRCLEWPQAVSGVLMSAATYKPAVPIIGGFSLLP